jgi:hypothetical protein
VALREPLRLNGSPDASALERLSQELLGAPFHTDPNAFRERFQPTRVSRWQTVGSYRASEPA